MIAVRILVGLLGGLGVLAVVLSAMRTVVLPRGEPVRLTGLVFGVVRKAFAIPLKHMRTYEARDHLMSHYAPVALLLLPLVWLSFAWLGFAGLFWAIEHDGVRQALTTSGSSLLTLGFEHPGSMPGVILAFTEAALAFSVLALLLVTYLPSMYAAFADREQSVTLFEVRAGNPPTATEMMVRYSRIRGFGETEQIWLEWERWFARVAESHVSLPALVFFRSPDPQQSWISAAGAVLDAAAMVAAVIDLTALDDVDGVVRRSGESVRMPAAETCIRAGYLCLRRIADHYQIPYDPSPAQTDPISITREEFETALDRMAEAGVPLRADRDDAWRNWAGWRVNYDAALLGIAELTIAPLTPWVSDRGLTLVARG